MTRGTRRIKDSLRSCSQNQKLAKQAFAKKDLDEYHKHAQLLIHDLHTAFNFTMEVILNHFLPAEQFGSKGFEERLNRLKEAVISPLDDEIDRAIAEIKLLRDKGDHSLNSPGYILTPDALDHHLKYIQEWINTELENVKKRPIDLGYCDFLVDTQKAQAMLLLKSVKVGEDRKGAVILVHGEGGTGKSRLAGTILDLAHRTGWDTFEYHCTPPGAVLKSFVDTITADLSKSNGYRGSATIKLPAESQRVARVGDTSSDDYTAPVRNRAMSFSQALYGRFEKTRTGGSAKPILISIDNMQWLTETETDEISILIRDYRKGPVVLMGVFGGDVEKASSPNLSRLMSLVERGRLVKLRLENIPKEKIKDAIRLMFWDKPSDFPEWFHELLYDATNGNIFFLRELLKGMTYVGDTRKSTPILVNNITDDEDDQSGKWVITKSKEDLEIPRRVKSVVTEILRRLDKESTGVAECAAVAGGLTNFPQVLVERLVERVDSQPQKTIEDALIRLAREGIIVFQQQHHDVAIRFLHELTKDQIYSNIDTERKKELHSATAAIMANDPNLRVLGEDYHETIANHFFQAEMHLDAARHYHIAANESVQNCLFRNATRQLEQSIAAMKRIQKFHSSEEELDVQIAYSDALRQCGDFGKAIEVLESIYPISDDSIRARGRILNMLGDLYCLNGSRELALQAYNECHKLAEAENLSELLLEVTSDLCEFYDREAERYSGNPNKVKELIEKGDQFLIQQVSLANKSNDDSAKARAARNQAKQMRRRGEFEQAIGIYKRALSFYSSQPNDHSVLIPYAKTLFLSYKSATRLGGAPALPARLAAKTRRQEAYNIVADLLKRGKKTGAKRTRAIARQYRGLFRMGDENSKAKKDLKAALKVFKEIKFARGLTETYIALGEWYLEKGKKKKAIEMFSSGLEIKGDIRHLALRAADTLDVMTETDRAERLRELVGGKRQRWPEARRT